jgi:predicted metal-dependent enzyme (double-stranded beta helix superfamily)
LIGILLSTKQSGLREGENMSWEPLKHAVRGLTQLTARCCSEPEVIKGARPILSKLIEDSSWLDSAYKEPHPEFYQQYLLYADPNDRFSIVSFVWGPGQSTPIHDHTVWGLVGVLEGAEKCQRYQRDAMGLVKPVGSEETCFPGDIDCVSPSVGDIHTVANALPNQPSISIHIYGANIGKTSRHVFKPDLAEPIHFISGYNPLPAPALGLS